MTITQVYVLLLALQAVAVTVCWLAGSVPATLMLFLSIVLGAVAKYLMDYPNAGSIIAGSWAALAAIASALIGGLIMVLS
jgi:hypothetical protein